MCVVTAMIEPLTESLRTVTSSVTHMDVPGTGVIAGNLGSNHLQGLFLPRHALTCTLTLPEEESKCSNKPRWGRGRDRTPPMQVALPVRSGMGYELDLITQGNSLPCVKCVKLVQPPPFSASRRGLDGAVFIRDFVRC